MLDTVKYIKHFNLRLQAKRQGLVITFSVNGLKDIFMVRSTIALRGCYFSRESLLFKPLRGHFPRIHFRSVFSILHIVGKSSSTFLNRDAGVDGWPPPFVTDSQQAW